MLTGLSLVMRFFSFFPSVMDHDESTYLVIADALLDSGIAPRVVEKVLGGNFVRAFGEIW